MRRKIVWDLLKILITPWMMFAVIFTMDKLKMRLLFSTPAAWYFVPLIGYLFIGVLFALMLDLSDETFHSRALMVVLIVQIVLPVCIYFLHIPAIYRNIKKFYDYTTVLLMGSYVYLLGKTIKSKI